MAREVLSILTGSGRLTATRSPQLRGACVKQCPAAFVTVTRAVQG